MKRFLVVSCLIAVSTACYADEFIYGNSAGGTAPIISKFDLTTGGTLVAQYDTSHGINGRGVVVVGNTMYYTSASTNSIFAYNLATNTDMGAVFSIPGATGLSTIAFDGTNLYIGDYSGTNKVYEYSLTGTLINTLSLSGCTGHCDGLEFFNQGGVGYLIENRGDDVGPYDVYNATTGALVTSDLINTANTTGIAFDGTDFFVSNLSGSLGEYTESGTFVKTIPLGGGVFDVEDLSVDYNLVIPPTNTPEPSTFLLLGTGVLGMAGVIRRKLRV